MPFGIGSRIEVTDELPGGMAMAQIDNRRWHLSYHLIVVYPRIEQWITWRHQDAEHEHTFVTKYIAHFLRPDVAHVSETIDYLI